MNQEDDIRGLAKVMDFIRGLYILFVVNLKLYDPTLPPGTEIFPEEGIGVHKFHIEITSR